MTYLRVRAYLRTPVIADAYFPLDGILFYQACRDRYGAQGVTLPGDACLDTGILPLEIVHAGQENWYYRCSWAQWSHSVEGRDYWNKRMDVSFASLIDFKGRRGKIMIEEGKYKAYHMPVFYRSVLWVEWYCVGDAGEINYLLSSVTHIGKKGAQGWGRVIEWRIDEIPDDWSLIRDGVLMRGIPMQDVPDNIVCDWVYYGLRPPYWHSANQMWLGGVKR